MRLATVLRRLNDDSGSGLTELAIVAPLFILLLFWAQFFVDVGLLKLKVDEAARYAVWEMAVQRPAAEVQAEVSQRFADLASPAQIDRPAPFGTRSFPLATVLVPELADTNDVPFDAYVRPPGGGGLINAILSFINRYVNGAVQWVLERMNFSTRGEARATVQFRTQNTLFPGGRLLGIFFDSGINPQITVTARSSPLLVDTWKAWPGKYALSNKSLNTSPYSTYPTGRGSNNAPTADSAPEREVAARMEHVAFLGLAGDGGVLDIVNDVIGFLGGNALPRLFGVTTWRTRQGPIAMLPGEPARRTFQPGYGTPVQRIGNHWHMSGAGYQTVDGSQDRSRYTLPSRVTTQWWTGKGGGLRNPNITRSNNPYEQAYQCRDGYYMGAMSQQLNRWGESAWTARAYPSCR